MFDISVVIPTYKANEALVDAIDSIFSHEGIKIQVVVVEDGSSKPSIDILQEYYAPHFKSDGKFNSASIKYLHQINQGAFLARLMGVKNSDGACIKFLDQDDVLVTGSLLNELAAFDENTDAVLSDWIIERQKDGGGFESERIRAPHLNSPIDDFLNYGGVFTSAALYRTSIVKRSLKPVPSFTPIKADDWLIFAQICIGGARYKTIDNVAYIWKQSESQLSKQSRDRLVYEHYNILNWIESELSSSDRLSSVRKRLLARYYSKQLLEAYSQHRNIYKKLIIKIEALYPSYRQEYGNQMYRFLCRIFGIPKGVKYYSFLKSIILGK